MSSSSSTKNCFNSNCKELLERSRKGWRRRTGEFAELCDRCASAYEEGKFCETFHLNASGWRCCESCGKQIHCGCIVSFHMFVLLDAGGIECITCARKSFILTPNPAWPPPSLILPVHPERIKDISTKNWSPIAGSGPVPWRQAPSLFNGTSVQSELQPRLPLEVDISGGIDKLFISDQLSLSSYEKKKKEDPFERLMNGSLKIGGSEMLENGNAGIKFEEQINSSVNVSKHLIFSKNDPSTPYFNLHETSALRKETNDQTEVSGTNAQRSTPSPQVGKQLCSHNGVDSSGEAQMHNGRSRDARGRSQLLPRYWPRITDQELQQISGDLNTVITPLFEKMLSASDAGRIGRLVLPKKCAEAYFPAISHPEGLPLKVQDLKGKEWVFQFRFWPNNNSRMYVLEGVTPCIQSMQLQAGDIVTFSRVEPEGKLVMGCRKASTAAPPDQGNDAVSTGNGVPTHGIVCTRNTKPGEVVSTHPHIKDNSISHGFSSINQITTADAVNTCSEADKSRHVVKEVPGVKPSSHSKRKNNTLGLKCKRLKMVNDDMLELKVTLAQAQGLLRPPPSDVPTIVVIEGIEIEEYEQDAPVIGRPTIFAMEHEGGMIQWVQCEDCFKWRKVPANVLLPSRWACSENSWDPERSLCSATQELTSEQLEDLVPNMMSCSNKAASKKMKAAKQDPDSIEAMEGLDTLANLAIQEQGETNPASSQATTKHPRHRPGCMCIVCIQPPSGKGHKHKQTCTCNVCSMVKRRFNTLMMNRERKQSEKEAETALQKLQQLESPEQVQDENIQPCSNIGNSSPKMVSSEGSVDDPNKRKPSTSPFKGQFDLNIQPEREEELLSPGSDSGGALRLLHDATERYVRQQHRLSSSGCNRNSVGNQIQLDETEGRHISNSNNTFDSSHENTDAEHHITVSTNATVFTSITDR